MADKHRRIDRSPTVTRERESAYRGLDISGTPDNVCGRVAIIYRPITELKLAPKNPRIHPARQARQIARSIEAFGFNVPVLIDSNLKVIAGHGRLLACQRLGWSEVKKRLKK